VASGPSAAELADGELVEQIRLVHRESRGNYGEPRVTAQLARDGVAVNHKRVARLMAGAGICGRTWRAKVRTTVADPTASPSKDLVGRDFVRHELDELWLGDITYVGSDEGWVYLSAVSDACSRRVLGWSITEHLRADGPLDALHAAVDCRGGAAGLGGVIFHSDKGSQYTSSDYAEACAGYGVVQSMGSVGDSYDNAQAESVWSSLKREAIDHQHFATKAQARAAIFSWIIWYNAARLHTSIGNRPPLEYEQRLVAGVLAA
jgi:transposase InsO family protein